MKGFVDLHVLNHNNFPIYGNIHIMYFLVGTKNYIHMKIDLQHARSGSRQPGLCLLI